MYCSFNRNTGCSNNSSYANNNRNCSNNCGCSNNNCNCSNSCGCSNTRNYENCINLLPERWSYGSGCTGSRISYGRSCN